jgi:diguanylate cyclase (GGDEF)-like protein
MTCMPTGFSGDVTSSGRRVKQRIILALALSAVIPLLVQAYILSTHVGPLLDPSRDQLTGLGLLALVFFTTVLVAVGSYMIWDVASAIARATDVLAGARQAHRLEGRRDEIGALMQSFSRMVGTIEAQAQEINGFAARLDAAYKELERNNSRLKEFSFRDEVTGLYNRRFFSIRLEEELSRHRRFSHPVSVVLLDLDGFKTVNDQLGHAAGDETLREVAHILLKHSRGINVIARYGGDEFAVLLVETSKAGARLYADRIRQVVATYPFSHGGRVTVSLGVASVPDDVEAVADEIIGSADEALYVAKRAGKNRVVGYDSVLAGKAIESGETVS